MADSIERHIPLCLISLPPLLFSLVLSGCSSIERETKNLCEFGHSRTLHGSESDDDFFDSEWGVENGIGLAIGGEHVGKIDWDIVSKKNEGASREIKRFIFDNGLLVGEPSKYEFKVTDHKLHYGSYAGPRITIRFHQILNGLSVPNSIIEFDSDSEVDYVRLLIASPCSPVFNQDNWLSEEELLDSLRRHVISHQDRYEPNQSIDVLGYVIGYTRSRKALVPLLELDYGSYRVMISALNGQIERFQNMVLQ